MRSLRFLIRGHISTSRFALEYCRILQQKRVAGHAFGAHSHLVAERIGPAHHQEAGIYIRHGWSDGRRSRWEAEAVENLPDCLRWPVPLGCAQECGHPSKIQRTVGVQVFFSGSLRSPASTLSPWSPVISTSAKLRASRQSAGSAIRQFSIHLILSPSDPKP